MKKSLQQLKHRLYAAARRFTESYLLRTGRELPGARRFLTRVHGHHMYLDPIDSLGLATVFEEYERFETNWMLEHIKPGDTVLDLGANIGFHALLFARAVGPQGKVYAFEPDPTNFKILTQNIAINGYQNVVAEQAAVADKDGELKLYFSETNRADHQVYESGEGRNVAATIPAVALDSYFKKSVPRVDFIKMDIQGFEGKATLGMKMLLKSNTPLTMVSEFWTAGLERSGVAPADYLASLEKHGFSFYKLSEASQTVSPVTASQLVTEFPTDREDYANLVCVKR